MRKCRNAHPKGLKVQQVVCSKGSLGEKKRSTPERRFKNDGAIEGSLPRRAGEINSIRGGDGTATHHMQTGHSPAGPHQKSHVPKASGGKGRTVRGRTQLLCGHLQICTKASPAPHACQAPSHPSIAPKGGIIVAKRRSLLAQAPLPKIAKATKSHPTPSSCIFCLPGRDGILIPPSPRLPLFLGQWCLLSYPDQGWHL